MGVPMLLCSHQEVNAMPDHPSKTAWERDNVIKITLKINRNQDPKLYELLQQSDSRNGLIRELLKKALNEPPSK